MADIKIGVEIAGSAESAKAIEQLKASITGTATSSKEANAAFETLAATEGALDSETEKAQLALALLDKELTNIESSDGGFKTKTAALEGMKDAFVAAKDEAVTLGTSGETAAANLDQAISKTEAALQRLQSETAESTGQIDVSFEHAEDAMRDFQKAAETGSPRVNSALNRLILTQNNFKEAIIDTYGSLDKATPAAIARYRQLETAVDKAKTKVRDLTDVLEDQRVGVGAGAAQWTSLESALQNVAGKYGAIVSKAIAVTAAFKEGWKIGMKLNEFFGADMSSYATATENFGAKLIAVWKGNAREIAALGTVMAEALDPGKDYAERIAAAWANFDTVRAAAHDNFMKDVAEQVATMQAADAAQDKSVVSTNALATAHLSAADAIRQRFAEEIKVLNALQENTVAQDALTTSLANAAAARDAGFVASQAYSEAVTNEASILSKLQQSYADAAANVTELSNTRTAGDPILEEAIRKEKNLALQVKATVDRLAESETAQGTAQTAYEEASTAIGDQKTKLGELEQKHKDLLAQFKEVSNKAPGVATALGTIQTPAASLATATTNVADGLRKIGEPVKVDGAVTGVNQLKGAVDALLESLRAVPEAAFAAMNAIEAMSNAGMDEGGGATKAGASRPAPPSRLKPTM